MPNESSIILPSGYGSLAVRNESGEPIVTIRFDGTVEINPKYTTSEVALAFWKEVEKIGRTRGPWQ